MTNTKLLGAIFAATFVLVFSSFMSTQQSFAQAAGTDTNAIPCNTSPPNRGVFLTVDGFNGPNGVSCKFEIKDFTFGVENPTTIGSATGGAGAGKAQFSEFTITKTTDSASPAFFKNAVTGKHITQVTLEMRKAGGDPKSSGKPFLTYTFGTVFTTKVSWKHSDDGPTEDITFVYGQLSVKYTPQNNDGTLGVPIVNCWDVVTNTNCQ